jgi:Tfp pilus assembly protein PilN
MRAVNLLPPDYARAHRQGPKLPAVIASPRRIAPIVAALLLVVLVGAGWVTQSRAVDQREETLASLQAELAARPKPEPVAAPTSDAAIRLASATAASAARLPWEEVLHQFALVLPADVSITALTATGTGAAAVDPAAAAPDPAAAVGGASGFTLTGYTVSQPAVARLMTRLNEAPTLANVRLQSSTRSEQEGRTVVDFSIVADVVREGAGS